jgi:hypothetical protein
LQASVPVTVLPIVPPVITVPTGSVILQQGVSGTLTPVSVAYSDGVVPGEQVSVTLSDSTGLLSVNAATVGGGGTVKGSGTTSLSIVGTLTAVDADLATLIYLSSTPGSDSVTVSASGTHGGSATPASFTVLTNAPPVITAPGALTVTAGVNTTVTGVSIADTDATSADETIRVDLSDNHGTLSATTAAPGGGGTITGSGSTHLIISGALSQVNADLNTLRDVETALGLDTIAVLASDGRGGSNSQAISVTATLPTPTTTVGALSGGLSLPTNADGTSISEGTTIAAPVAYFQDTNLSDPQGAFTALINWDDGTSTVGVVSGSNGSFSVSPSGSGHIYADEGSYTLAVAISGPAGTTLPLTGTLPVADADVLSPGPDASVYSSKLLSVFRSCEPLTSRFRQTKGWAF